MAVTGNASKSDTTNSDHGQEIIDRAAEINKQTWDIVNRLRVVRGKLLPSRPDDREGRERVEGEQAPANFVERMRSAQDGQANAVDDLRRLVTELEKF